MDEVLVSTSTAGDQGQPSVAAFRGTQFIVVWEDRNDATIKGQMFGVNGSKSSGEFLVNIPTEPGAPTPRRQLPAIIEYSAGFAVAWIEQAPGVPSTAPAQVKLRTFDQDTLSGPEIQVSTAAVEPLSRPVMTSLADGGFVVVWVDKRRDERIRAQRFGLDGTKNGPEFRANTTPELHRLPLVARLANGNIVIAWRARSPAPLLVRFQIFDANGPVGGEQVTSLDVTDIAMTALDSGRFVIAHIRSAFDGEVGFDTTVARASVFESSGVFSGIQFVATAEQRIQSAWPTLAPLSGERFLLAWTQHNVDNVAAGTDVKARMFSTQGAVGQIARVNTSTGSQRFSLSAATTSGPEGEIAFAAWADDSQSGGDTSGRAVRGRALPTPSGGF
jgi:hypothetical protein